MEPGIFVSPQTPALSSDGATLFVPDYAIGIAAVNIATGTVTWITHSDSLALTGIDGMYRVGRDLIVVQNGLEPNRIMRLTLDAPMRRVVRAVALARGPLARTLTHATVAGGWLYFITKSGWERVADDGTMTAAENRRTRPASCACASRRSSSARSRPFAAFAPPQRDSGAFARRRHARHVEPANLRHRKRAVKQHRVVIAAEIEVLAIALLHVLPQARPLLDAREVRVELHVVELRALQLRLRLRPLLKRIAHHEGDGRVAGHVAGVQADVDDDVGVDAQHPLQIGELHLHRISAVDVRIVHHHVLRVHRPPFDVRRVRVDASAAGAANRE